MSHRPPIPDDDALRDATLAHAVAITDRVAELQRRIDAALDRFEACTRAPDGQQIVMKLEARTALDEVFAASCQA